MSDCDNRPKKRVLKYMVDDLSLKEIASFNPLTELFKERIQIPHINMNSELFKSQISELRVPLFELNNSFLQSTQLLSERYSNLAFSISEMMSPHAAAIESLQKSIEPFAAQMQRIQFGLADFSAQYARTFEQIRILNEPLITSVNNAVAGINSVLSQYPKALLIRIKLYSDYWIILDETLLAEIVEEELSENSEIVKKVLDHYKEDGWKRLEAIVETWHSIIHSDRVMVFTSAITAAKQSIEDVHLLTVPAVIAQIDGLIRELRSALPSDTKKRIEQKIRESLPVEIKERADVRNEVAVQTVYELVDFLSAEMLQEVIFTGLFRDSKEIKPEESFALFRHKIMHGDKEYLKYENEENFIRLMLYVDFIVSLIAQIRDGSANLEENQ